MRQVILVKYKELRDKGRNRQKGDDLPRGAKRVGDEGGSSQVPWLIRGWQVMTCLRLRSM